MLCESCDKEVMFVSAEVRDQMSTGCICLKDLSDEVQEEIYSQLRQTILNYYHRSEHPEIKCCLTNQYSRNYVFVIRNLNFMKVANECFMVFQNSEGCNETSLTNGFRELFGWLLHGTFPNHFFKYGNRAKKDMEEQLRHIRQTLCS